MDEIRKCCQCKQEKLLEEFVKDNRRKSGYSTLCKECKRLRDKERYNRLKDNEEFHSRKLAHNKKYKSEHKEQIKEACFEYNMRPEVVERKAGWHQSKKRSISTKLGDMLNRAIHRAKEKSVPCTITKEDIIFTNMCPLLNINLNWEGGPRDKNTPSLDRIVPELGYVPGNIKIISNLANMIKSYASKEELLTFANNINNYFENKEIVQAIENINL